MLLNYDSSEKQTASTQLGEKQTVRWRMKNKIGAEQWSDSNAWMQKTMNNDSNGETQ